ncbi:hypothetical protein IV500_12395 [Paeniglutamicibacter antarcticus]|uniref:Uncharacterized protein n=1 Tax=Arthrobacter terrae TaxID=2935737 RepID=A0A931CPU1_9MICC|nr:hypothetical protein [Arthrobacter terrae]MBG0740180.1 hypothetical protein [Arthrobacter terrae]
MLHLLQDSDGFIHMSRHFPNKMSIAVTFIDGTQRQFSGARINELYDQALAAYRRGNNLDAKGFDRRARNIHRRNDIGLVPVSPDMAT